MKKYDCSNAESLCRRAAVCKPQEQMRVLKEAKELAAATFRPDLSPSRQRAGESFAVSIQDASTMSVHTTPCS